MSKYISKKQLYQEFEQLNASTPENYMRIILESIVAYNYRARLDIAEILYDKYCSLPQNDPIYDNLKRNLFAEIFSKLMQALEDAALLAIMFSDNSKTPLEHYTSNNNQAIYDFFGKAKRGKGLRESILLKMYGLKPINTLLKEGHIEPSETQAFKNEYNTFFYGNSKIQGERLRWKGLGKIYTENRKSIQEKLQFTKSSIVKAYFNIKHAYKVLLPSTTYRKIWPKINDDLEISIVERYEALNKLRKKVPKDFKKYESLKLLKINTFRVTKEDVKAFFTRIFPQVQALYMIAQFHLKLMDDPTYMVREMRFVIYRDGTKPEPKPYEPCPCRSGKKYKKCHIKRGTIMHELVKMEEKYSNENT